MIFLFLSLKNNSLYNNEKEENEKHCVILMEFILFINLPLISVTRNRGSLVLFEFYSMYKLIPCSEDYFIMCYYEIIKLYSCWMLRE